MDPRADADVLLVEDDSLAAQLVETMLASLGHTFVTVQDVNSALLELGRRKFSILITDVVLPGKTNGLQLATIAHARYPELRIVITTAHSHLAESGHRMTYAAVLIK